MIRLSLLLSLLLATTATSALNTFDVRGSVPFETTLDGAPYPEYGSILLRCDAGSCTLQKVTFLCDREDTDVTQATVVANRIRVTRVPSKALPQLALQIDDFGTDYQCSFNLKLLPTSSDGTLHVDSYSCTYLSAWHGNKQKVERSVDQLDLKRQCKKLVLKKSAW